MASLNLINIRIKDAFINDVGIKIFASCMKTCTNCSRMLQLLQIHKEGVDDQ